MYFLNNILSTDDNVETHPLYVFLEKKNEAVTAWGNLR